MPPTAARALRELERRGLLLVTDAELPSVTRLVAGEPVRGSWWSHPRARAIYGVLEALEDDDTALFVKLVSKKVTVVHRSLWRELFTVALARESWQTKGLSSEARALSKRVERAGSLRAEKRDTKSARELEERLLVHGAQEHTETGAHAKVLETWTCCASRKHYRPKQGDPESARRVLEGRLATDDWSGAKLPWQGRSP